MILVGVTPEVFSLWTVVKFFSSEEKLSLKAQLEPQICK